jgi:hypothetical protein
MTDNKHTPSAEKKRSDEEALNVSSGGPLEARKEYSQERDLHCGQGDVSGWPTAEVKLTAEQHQAESDAAVAAADSEHKQRRGPRKNLQP